MQLALTVFIILIVLLCCVPISSGFISSLALIVAVVALLMMLKRNFEISKHNLNKQPEDMLIIQNVQKGGIIRVANVDGFDTDIDLKVINRNLYIEGDYSWYELECVNGDGEKFWIDVDDDDELVVSIVLKKPRINELKFSKSLHDIDDDESGSVTYKGDRYNYVDSADVEFYKYCDDSRKEKLYYWDFKQGNHMITVEKWSGEKAGTDYYYSQILKPSSITVYSTKGESNGN